MNENIAMPRPFREGAQEVSREQIVTRLVWLKVQKLKTDAEFEKFKQEFFSR